MNESIEELFQTTFGELYTINTLINVTINLCKEYEFKGEYYGCTRNVISRLSAERNDYINMLEILNDKVNTLIENCLKIEKEITL